MLQRFNLVAELNRLGNEIYGGEWPRVLALNVQRLTASESTDIGALDEQEIELLIKGMRKLVEMRKR
jgi:hypothetical protein